MGVCNYHHYFGAALCAGFASAWADVLGYSAGTNNACCGYETN